MTGPLRLTPFGVWLIAGTPASDPYPCRCHERKYGKCSAQWCVCAYRPDPQGSECCANWFTPDKLPTGGGVPHEST